MEKELQPNKNKRNKNEKMAYLPTYTQLRRVESVVSHLLVSERNPLTPYQD